MNNPDCDKNVCSQDDYGNVTANEQGGNDVRNETLYKDFTIDDGGISVIVWKPNGGWFGKFTNAVAAKTAIDNAILLSK